MGPSPLVLDVLDCSTRHVVSFTDGSAGKVLRDQGADQWNIYISKFLSAHALSAHVRPRNVLPVIARNNLVKSFGRNAVIRANIFPIISSGNPVQDTNNIGFSQFRRARFAPLILAVKAGVISVLNVLRVCNPLKITQPVVGLIAVDMVRYVLWCWRRANKRLQNKAVDYVRALPNARICEADRKVASRNWKGFEKPVSRTTWTSRKALHFSKVANRVAVLPTRYVFPVFHNSDVADMELIVNPHSA